MGLKLAFDGQEFWSVSRSSEQQTHTPEAVVEWLRQRKLRFQMGPGRPYAELVEVEFMSVFDQDQFMRDFAPEGGRLTPWNPVQ